MFSGLVVGTTVEIPMKDALAFFTNKVHIKNGCLVPIGRVNFVREARLQVGYEPMTHPTGG